MIIVCAALPDMNPVDVLHYLEKFELWIATGTIDQLNKPWTSDTKSQSLSEKTETSTARCGCSLSTLLFILRGSSCVHISHDRRAAQNSEAEGPVLKCWQVLKQVLEQMRSNIWYTNWRIHKYSVYLLHIWKCPLNIEVVSVPPQTTLRFGLNKNSMKMATLLLVARIFTLTMLIFTFYIHDL